MSRPTQRRILLHTIIVLVALALPQHLQAPSSTPLGGCAALPCVALFLLHPAF
jgi:hypothetical protein